MSVLSETLKRWRENAKAKAAAIAQQVTADAALPPASGPSPGVSPTPRRGTNNVVPLRQVMPESTPEPQSESMPLLYTKGGATGGVNIAHEFDGSARWYDEATSNWRADQNKTWK